VKFDFFRVGGSITVGLAQWDKNASFVHLFKFFGAEIVFKWLVFM